jgi:hypothetical protein
MACPWHDGKPVAISLGACKVDDSATSTRHVHPPRILLQCPHMACVSETEGGTFEIPRGQKACFLNRIIMQSRLTLLLSMPLQEKWPPTVGIPGFHVPVRCLNAKWLGSERHTSDQKMNDFLWESVFEVSLANKPELDIVMDTGDLLVPL